MDDKTRKLIEDLVGELGDQCMSAAADAMINEDRPSVAKHCRKYAEERRSYADAVKAVVEENERLRNSLRWTLNYMADGMNKSDTPTHYCGYENEHTGGYCDFHTKYWTARELAFPEEFDGTEEE